MVVAWLFDESDADQREPHQLSPNVEVSLAELAELGVLHWTIDVTKEDYMDKVEAICTERNYKNRDTINIRKDTLPNFEQKIKSFFEEHIHDDEEIRFILDGSGYFDVRSKDDKWIRILCSASDMIILPAGMYHRFTLDNNNYIKAMRLFKDDPKWTPINRSVASTDENPLRVEYIKALKAGEFVAAATARKTGAEEPESKKHSLEAEIGDVIEAKKAATATSAIITAPAAV